MSIGLKDPVAEAMHLSGALLREKRMLNQSRAGQFGYQGDSKANGLFSTFPGRGENAVHLHMHPAWAVQIALPLNCPARVLVLVLQALSHTALAWQGRSCLAFSLYLCIIHRICQILRG